MNLFLKSLNKFGGNKKEKDLPKTTTEVKPITKKSSKPRVNTKHQLVKKHLFEKGWIDTWTAIELFGATRLSAIIFNLRKEGYDIISSPNSSNDRNNELCNYTTYKYINDNGDN
jgi:hypothetical protein